MNREMIFKERTRLFMKYINDHDIPRDKSKLTFGDIDPDYLSLYPERLVYSWLTHELHDNLCQFQNEVHKYQDIYPQASDRINARINLNSEENKKRVRLDRGMMIMRYLNHPDNRIPNVRKDLRFCDVDPDSQDECKMGIYLQTNPKFYEENLEYRDLYPVAYQRLVTRDTKKNKGLGESQRIDVMVRFLENCYLSGKDRFCDIGGNDYDQVYVQNWCYKQFISNGDTFLEKIRESCKNHHVDEEKIFYKLDRRKTGDRIYSLKERTRTELLMIYLEEYEFPSGNVKVHFCDIDKECQDDADIMLWFSRNMGKYKHEFLEEFLRFKDYYPRACQKIIYRSIKFLDRRNMNEIPYSTKIDLFMRYLEENDVNWVNNKITFYDLDHSFQSHSSVVIWIRNEFEFTLSRLIDEIDKYKLIYPKAYQKIVNKINDSDFRLQRERLLLLENLKMIKKQLEEENISSLTKKLAKS